MINFDCFSFHHTSLHLKRFVRTFIAALQDFYISVMCILDTQSDQPAEATFTSPKVQLSTPHCLSFYYYMVGSNIGYLNVSTLLSLSLIGVIF